jgi:integrase
MPHGRSYGGQGTLGRVVAGAHDLRHTYATWLEDAGIPARVIDELMGHQASSRGGLGGSVIGAHYRHTTPEMAARPLFLVRHVHGMRSSS